MAFGLSYVLQGIIIFQFIVVSPARPSEESAPRITEQPKSLMVARGDPASFNCRAEGRPEPTISWLKNGRPLVIRYERHAVLASGSFFILQVIGNGQGGQDGGIYQCVARNSHGVAYSASATLEVAYLRDEFQEEPVSVQLISGDSAVLGCTPPRGYPTPEVTWLKEDQPIIVDNIRVNIVEDGNLLLKELRKDDEGTYKCEARNIAGGRVSREAVLTVQVKPAFINPPQDTITAPGETAVLRCEVEGDPRPTVSWSRELGELPEGRTQQLDDNSLRIRHTEELDDGVYICTVQNILGTSDAKARLRVSVPCPVPALTTGLEVSGCTAEGEAAVGATCTYSCTSGSLNGDAILTCGSEGTFSPAVPTCDVPCPVPALKTGLEVTGCTAEGEAAVGATCTYSCTSGSLNGDAMVTCGSEGTFSPAVPTCDGHAITCTSCTEMTSDYPNFPLPPAEADCSTNPGEVVCEEGCMTTIITMEITLATVTLKMTQTQRGCRPPAEAGFPTGDICADQATVDTAAVNFPDPATLFPPELGLTLENLDVSLCTCDSSDRCTPPSPATGGGTELTEPSEFQIRLVNGSHPWEGRVELFYQGEWGTICSSYWGKNDGDVACRMLGYNGAYEAISPTGAYYPRRFAEGTGPILLSDFRCTGTEANLAECSHSGWGDHNCYHWSDASLICNSPDPDSVVVRLVNGRSKAEGRVEVLYEGEFGTVCDDSWDINDANVICRMLGYEGASEAPGSARFGRGSGDIVMDDVVCLGSEENIASCEHSGWGTHNCDHGEDAGVVCTGELSLPVRLVNGDSDNEGRVEIYRYGDWGTVCDDFWDINDGNVVCRMLGYQRASRIWWGTTYGPGRGWILLDNVECTGLEATLDDCVHPGWGVHDCDHYEDAGVVCA